MQDLVKALSADEPPPAAYTIGETLHTEVWRSEMRDQDFRSPTGAPVTVRRELVGERYSVAFTPDELGFYTLGSPRPLYAFGINASPDEADLRPIDKNVLPRDFAGEHEAHFVGGAEDFDELAKGRPLFHWFILGAVALLLLESGFQYTAQTKGGGVNAYSQDTAGLFETPTASFIPARGKARRSVLLVLFPLGAAAQGQAVPQEATGGVVLDPMLPMPLVALLAGVLLFLTARIYFKVGAGLGRWRKWLLLAFRAGGLALVLLLLLGPSRREALPPPPKERVTLIGVDTSLSMKQRDVQRASRLDAAKNALLDAGLIGRNGVPENPRLRFFEFGADAQPVVKSILDLAPKAPTTRLNQSVLTMLNIPAGKRRRQRTGPAHRRPRFRVGEPGADRRRCAPAPGPHLRCADGQAGKSPGRFRSHHRFPAVLLCQTEGPRGRRARWIMTLNGACRAAGGLRASTHRSRRSEDGLLLDLTRGAAKTHNGCC